MAISRKFLLAGAAVTLALGAHGAAAQTTVAVELAPGSGDVSLSVSSRGFETASGFVRGCPGYIPDAVDGASFVLAPGVNEFTIEGQGPNTVAMVIEAPSGTYSCAVAQDGTITHGILRPAPGRYTVLPSSQAIGARITTSVTAGVGAPAAVVTPPVMPPVTPPVTPPVVQSGVIDITRLGPPRQGTATLDRAAAQVRQLVAQAPFTVTTRANQVTPENVWCAGHIAPDAADLVFTLDATESISFFTLSDGDPVLAIRDPSGTWRCNDDSFGLNSALTYNNAMPGDYHIWVGSFGSAGRGSYQLYVSLGAPRWTVDAPSTGGGSGGLNTEGAPRAGLVQFDPVAAQVRQTLATAPIVSTTRIDPLIPGQYCAGHVGTDGPDVVLTVDEGVSALSIFALSSVDLTLSILGPDGRWSCNDDSFGLNPNVTYRNVTAGDYRIWVGSFGQGRVGTYELFASAGPPRWSMDTINTEGEPRAGRVRLDQVAAQSRQLLATAPIVSTTRIDPLIPGQYCAGHVGTDGPDVVLTVDQMMHTLSIFALSSVDLTLSILGPDGRWSCNDDSFGLNPGITFTGVMPGDYRIWVGSFGQGRSGSYDLFATAGQPRWVDVDLDGSAPPSAGYLTIGTETDRGFRMPISMAASQIPASSFDAFCPGFITPDQPTVVVTIEDVMEELTFYAVSSADGMMLIQQPDGTFLCNDDFQGLNPGIVLQNADPGDYAVWVGTYGGQGGSGTFGVTRDVPLWTVDRDL